MRVLGCRNLRHTRFDGGYKLQQGSAIERLGEALTVHNAATLQFGIRVQEAVSGDELHLRGGRPAA